MTSGISDLTSLVSNLHYNDKFYIWKGLAYIFILYTINYSEKKKNNKDDILFTLFWFSLSMDLYDERLLQQIYRAEIWLNSQHVYQIPSRTHKHYG